MRLCVCVYVYVCVCASLGARACVFDLHASLCTMLSPASAVYCKRDKGKVDVKGTLDLREVHIRGKPAWFPVCMCACVFHHGGQPLFRREGE